MSDVTDPRLVTYWNLSAEDRYRVDQQNALARAFLVAQAQANKRIRGSRTDQ